MASLNYAHRYPQSASQLTWQFVFKLWRICCFLYVASMLGWVGPNTLVAAQPNKTTTFSAVGFKCNQLASPVQVQCRSMLPSSAIQSFGYWLDVNLKLDTKFKCCKCSLYTNVPCPALILLTLRLCQRPDAVVPGMPHGCYHCCLEQSRLRSCSHQHGC